MAFTAFQHMGDLVGTLAASLTTAAFIPQAWQTWKTRQAKGVSLGMYCIFTIGVIPLLGQILPMVLALFILFMKLRFG